MLITFSQELNSKEDDKLRHMYHYTKNNANN